MSAYLRREDRAVRILKGDIAGKRVLEPACGRASFSVCASKLAREVWCSDIRDSLLPCDISSYKNIRFDVADVSRMAYADGFFDCAVLYNAIGHIDSVIPEAISECRRVVSGGGCTVVISSSKMDKAVIGDILVPHLDASAMRYEIMNDRNFTWVRIW